MNGTLTPKPIVDRLSRLEAERDIGRRELANADAEFTALGDGPRDFLRKEDAAQRAESLRQHGAALDREICRETEIAELAGRIDVERLDAERERDELTAVLASSTATPSVDDLCRLRGLDRAISSFARLLASANGEPPPGTLNSLRGLQQLALDRSRLLDHRCDIAVSRSRKVEQSPNADADRLRQLLSV